MGIQLTIALSLLALPAGEGSLIRIETSAAQGLGAQEDVARRDPSDVIQLGDRHVVLYTRVEESAPLFPAPYTGEIWWASSRDEGHTWQEQGKLLGPDGRGGDALGVFDPNVLDVPGEGLVLFYSGIGRGFNFRFQQQSRPEETRLFTARLDWDPVTGSLSAVRDPEAKAILKPTSPHDHGFDSTRVRRAKPFWIEGQVHLYYRGTSSDRGTRGEALGLAVSPASDRTFRRKHESRAILPFRGDALLMEHPDGVLALFTGRDRGAWLATDREHFAPLDVEVRGRLSSPGIAIDFVNKWDGLSPRWGLHVAREGPRLWLERFELTVRSAFIPPVDASTPQEGGAWFVDPQRRGFSWKEWHQKLADQAAEAETLFLGGTLVSGFHRNGQEAWKRLFAGHKDANLGMGRDTTSNLLWRVDHGALPSGKQRLILIQVSCEQALSDGPQAITRGVDTLVRRIRARKPEARIWVIPPQTTPWMTEQEVAKIGRAKETLARFIPQPKVALIDPWIEFVNDSGELNAPLFAATGEELTPLGYEIYAETLLLSMDKEGEQAR